MTTNKTSKRKYLDQFTILSRSGVGVILTHAREPHRVMEALREWAFTRINPMPYHDWNVVNGWSMWEVPPPNGMILSPKVDGIREMVPALAKVAAEEGVFVMHYPHWTLPKSPVAIQALKIYAQDFRYTNVRRLVLVVPDGFSLPVELENDVVIHDFDLPTREELRAIYNRTLKGVMPKGKAIKPPFNDEQIESIVSIGAGMTEMEFDNAISKGFVTNEATLPKIPLNDFTRVISETKIEVVKRSEVLEVLQPVPLEEVGGLDLYKGWIIKRKPCFSEDFRTFCGDRDYPKGCSLIGPPGTGKTLVGSATASVLGIPFFRLDIAKVFGKYVGDSEARIHGALKLLEAMAPCVVLIDEVDKAGFTGAGGDGGTRDRVMGVILYKMQIGTHPIFWILTANRVENLPAEMLRKGRLDEVFSVQPPNAVERLQVLKIHLKLRNQDPEAIKDLSVAVEASDGFVPAELEAAVKESVVDAFGSGEPITGEMIASQLKNMQPISIAFKDQFEAMANWGRLNARPASTQIEIRSRQRSRSRSIEVNGQN